MLHTEVLEPGTLALPFGHRLSIDLDFFTADPFDKEVVKVELVVIGDWITNSENKIGLRGAKKDFYDIFFLLKQHSFAQLCEWYKQKFRTNNLFMLLKSLTYFDDAKATEMPVLPGKKPDWDVVKKTLLSEVDRYVV